MKLKIPLLTDSKSSSVTGFGQLQIPNHEARPFSMSSFTSLHVHISSYLKLIFFLLGLNMWYLYFSFIYWSRRQEGKTRMQSQKTWIQVEKLLVPGCVTEDKLLNLLNLKVSFCKLQKSLPVLLPSQDCCKAQMKKRHVSVVSCTVLYKCC